MSRIRNIHIKIISVTILTALLLSAILTAGVRDQAHIKLLAVTEAKNDTYGGSIADLYLDIESGSGRVFIDTLPASKLDTQMSTRLAKSIACKYADVNCEQLDFFYTIRANSAIVGGPSAGAATAIATLAVLENLDLRDDIAVTGTISSGNLIGPVGGLKEKILAASESGIKTVLIPAGEQEQKEDNETLDLIDYGRTLNMTVIEVGTLNEALLHFSGKTLEDPETAIDINPEYTSTMQMLSEKLCNRSNKLHVALNKELMRHQILVIEVEDEIFTGQSFASNLTIKGKEAGEKKDYYSSASYCFGANVAYSRLLLQVESPSLKTIYEQLNQTKTNLLVLNTKISKEGINTITDLETYMVVKDRLIEANEHVNRAYEQLREKNERDALAEFAYANERFYSALSWTEFLGNDGKKFKINPEDLQASCTRKLSEAEEFYQYMDLIFPRILKDARDELDKARVDSDRGHYELCLYKATIAKSQINMLSSLIGLSDDKVLELLDRKLAAAERVIVEQQKKDIFPILGYSYYEYAKSLRNENKYSALLYAEYALELSNLDVYFKTKNRFNWSIQREWVIIFIGGVLIGFVIGDVVGGWSRKREEKSRKGDKNKRKRRR